MGGFLDYYLSWAGPARRAFAAGYAWSLPAAYASSEAVLVCGMGGSGVAGDYLASVAGFYGGAPVYVVKGADVPAWVGRSVLVFAVSFSGNTRETLECARRAVERGARVAAVTTGGRLAVWARERGLPVAIVEEAPAPRAGWPQLFYTLLGAAAGAGLVYAPRADVEESLSLLENRERVEGDAERLARIAAEAGSLLVAVAPEPYAAVARRLGSEFAENAKRLVVPAELPEAGHNMLEAWASSGVTIEFIVLDPGVEPWSGLLAEALGLARPAALHRFVLEGSSPLAKLVWGTWLAGVASVRAALLRGVDPEKLTAVKSFRAVVEKVTRWGA
ncbi:MAG: SIS domain-containing protein [Crenarchaeota archaeon]|nr:SIS domain-containing protein [Thermoproteota archaeon]